MLWNPSIGRTKIIPFPDPEITETTWTADWGLGFDPLVNDRKLVRLVKNDGNSLHQIDVYSIGSQSWKTLQFKGKACSGWRWCGEAETVSDAICLNGVLYFVRFNLDTRLYGLLSFDLNSDVFGPVGMPPMDRFESTTLMMHPVLVDSGSSLGLVTIWQFPKSQASIWVMESGGRDIGSVHWTKRYAFPMDSHAVRSSDYAHFRYLYLKKNGEMVVEWMYDEEVKSYNLETRKLNTILNTDDQYYPCLVKVCRYVESLALLNGRLEYSSLK